MTKTFTDESGKQWRRYALHHDGRYVIEPIPAPPQTEAEILAEMDKKLAQARQAFLNGQIGADVFDEQKARAILAACKKIAEVK